jgi:hypothetical protein
MLQQTGQPLEFSAIFRKNGEPQTGLTVYCTVYNPEGLIVRDLATATELGTSRIYTYTYEPGELDDTTPGKWRAMFSCADETLDDRGVPSIAFMGYEWVERIDTVISDLALLLTQIRGSGWTGQNIADISTAIDNIPTNPAVAGDAMTLAPNQVVKSVTDDVGITQAAADKVWGSASRTLTGFGTLIADIWGYATRKLTGTKQSFDDLNDAPATDISNLPTKVDLANARVAVIASVESIPPTDLTGIATSQNVTDATTTITTAIDNKAVTPATDLSDIETTVTAVKAVTDQIVITEGKVAASATASVDPEVVQDAVTAALGDVTDALASIDNKLNATAVTVQSGVLDGGDVLTVRGDGYTTDAPDNAIKWTYTGYDLTNADVEVLIGINGHILTESITPVAVGDDWSLVLELNNEQTTTIPQGTVKYAIKATWPDVKPVTIIEGSWRSKQVP